MSEWNLRFASVIASNINNIIQCQQDIFHNDLDLAAWRNSPDASIMRLSSPAHASRLPDPLSWYPTVLGAN